MKKTVLRVACAVIAVCLSGVMSSCSMATFDGDLRARYDYNLKEYLKTGKYSGIEVYVGNTDVTEEELNNSVNRNRVFGCDWTDIYDRPCAEGDIVGVTYQGYTVGDGDKEDRMITSLNKGFLKGEPVSDDMEELSNSSSLTQSIVLGCDELFPGFDEQIIGLSVGDRKTLTYTLPEPCWEYPDYAGEEIEMDVVLTYIQEIQYQEYNDEYASNSGYGDIENYEFTMNNSLIKTRTSQVETYVNTRVWKQINANFEVKKYPEKELAENRAKLEQSYKESAERYSLTLEEYVDQKLGISMDKFNENLEEDAKSVTKDEMIVYYIARNEKMGLLDEEYEEKALEMAEEESFSDLDQYITYRAYYYGGYDSDTEITDEIRTETINSLKETILFEKVDDFVYENTTQKTEK